MTGARRLKTDCNAEICPDLYFDDDVWFECKSVGKTSAIIIYEHRHEKYLRFVSRGNSLYYWIWHHSGKVGAAETANDIRREVASSLRSVYVIDQRTLHGLLSGTPQSLNSHYYSGGLGREVFRGAGWKVPIKAIQSHCLLNSRTVPMYVRGVFVKSVPVYFG
jgi:hypothetical protein